MYTGEILSVKTLNPNNKINLQLWWSSRRLEEHSTHTHSSLQAPAQPSRAHSLTLQNTERWLGGHRDLGYGITETAAPMETESNETVDLGPLIFKMKILQRGSDSTS